MKHKIGILTGGGDCPGLNAVIRAAVKTAVNRGWEVIGIREGFEGLLHPDKLTVTLSARDVAGILNVGGTILGTTNRGNPFQLTVKVKGKPVTRDVSDRVVTGFRRLGLTALIAIGGDGTLGIAEQLYRKGIPLVGVPKTIDNDLSATVITFGFDTAVSTATDALDKLHSTAESHRRTMVVEVMGRYAGWIALNSGVAGGADVILIPEIPFSLEKVCEKVESRYRKGPQFCIVVAAEGAKPTGGKMFTRTVTEKGRQEPILGGIAQYIAEQISKFTGRETRSLVLGHLQRGGNPTTFDRLIATRFGAGAVRLIGEGKFGCMVALHPPQVSAVPLKEAIGKMNAVPLNCDTIISARNLGISFGD